MKKALVIAAGTVWICAAQVDSIINPTTGQRDYIGAKSGTSLPATCVVGQLFFKTVTTIGEYFCSSTNTWTIVSQSPGTGITDMNTDSTSSQTMTVGTAGTDFAITNPGGGSHVFNLPTATASHRGALSSADWSTFNGKESVLTFNAPLSRSTNTITCPTCVRSDQGNSWSTGNQTMASATSFTLPTAAGTSIATAAGMIGYDSSATQYTGYIGAAVRRFVLDNTALGGDLTGTVGNATLASVVSSGSCGDTTHSCGLTIDVKGRITAFTNNVISGGGGGGGANTSLSNLSSVGINASLLPSAAGTLNLGSTSLSWGALYLAGTSTSPSSNYFSLTGASTGGARTVTFPDANSNTIRGISDPSDANCVTWIGADGTQHRTTSGCGGGGGGGGSVFNGSRVATLAFSATPTFNLADSSNQSPVRINFGQFTANVTSVAFTNPAAGAKFSIVFKQGASSAFSLTWGGSADNVCVPLPDLGSTMEQFLEVDSDGATIHGAGCVMGGVSNVSGFGNTSSAPSITPASGRVDCRYTDSGGIDCLTSDGVHHTLVLSGAANAVTYNAGGTTTLDFSKASANSFTIGASSTTLAITNANGIGPFYIVATQPGSPVTNPLIFPGSVVVAPQPPPVASSVSIIMCTGMSGPNYYCGLISTTANGLIIPEGTVSGISGNSVVYDDPTTHNLFLSNNGGTGAPFLISAATGVQTFLTTPSSANLAAALTDETGSGSSVFATSPTLVTPTLGAATATSVNKVTITAPASSATLTIANSKTLTASNTLTLTGTDSSSVAFGTGGTVAYTIASGTKALATSAISSATCTSAQTATATGTASTDSVIFTPNADITGTTGYVPATTGGLTIVAYPTTDTVNFKVCNWTSGSITPGAVSLNWRVAR